MANNLHKLLLGAAIAALVGTLLVAKTRPDR